MKTREVSKNQNPSESPRCEEGRIYFTKNEEKRFFFFMTIIMLLLGVLAKFDLI